MAPESKQHRWARQELDALRALPLKRKIERTKQYIDAWHMAWRGMVYVGFSGGKDSTVLLHIVRQMFPDVPAVFCDTGLEYPEVRSFAMSQPNVVTVRPKMPFNEVIKRYGFPAISKRVARAIDVLCHPTPENENLCRLHREGINSKGRSAPAFRVPMKWRRLFDPKLLGHQPPFMLSDKCCDIMKKNPAKEYERETGRHPMLGTLAAESRQREQTYLLHGCNNVDGNRPVSTPMSFWTEQDVLAYLRQKRLSIAGVYGEIVKDKDSSRLRTTGCQRTGCVFCCFGAHLSDEGTDQNRFQLLKRTHPGLWDYCINKLGMGVLLNYIGVDFGAEPQQEIKKMNDRTSGMRQDLSKMDLEIKAKQAELDELKGQRNVLVLAIEAIEGKPLSMTHEKKSAAPIKKTKQTKTEPKQTKAPRAVSGKSVPTVEDAVKAIRTGASTPAEVRKAIGLGESHPGTWRKLAAELKADKRIKDAGSGKNTRFVPV